MGIHSNSCVCLEEHQGSVSPFSPWKWDAQRLLCCSFYLVVGAVSKEPEVTDWLFHSVAKGFSESLWGLGSTCAQLVSEALQVEVVERLLDRKSNPCQVPAAEGRWLWPA